MNKTLSERLPENHPIFAGWRKLTIKDVLQDRDETACVSTLLSLEFPENWRSVDNDCHGLTVLEALEDDIDRSERVFRRNPKYDDIS